jgi:tetratricopeptide (TPR) repeat protein
VAKLNRLQGQFSKALEEGAFDRAVETAREIASLRERWQGERHGESVAARGAVRWCEGLLRLPEKDQQEVARSFRAHAEGSALSGQHKYRAAEERHRQALAIRRKVLGEEHPDTATSYNNVGYNLSEQGKYAEAQPLYEKALAIRRKVLGEEHPDTASSYNNVAAHLSDQGKYAEAQPLYEKALAIRRKVLGEVHPDTAQSYNNVALNLSDQGKYAEAQPLHEKALAICRKVLGEEHPETARSYNNVALNLSHQGKYAEAQPLYEKALAICRKVLGEEHSHTATCYNNVAANLNAQGKYAEAQPLYEKALAIRRKVLGEQHPLTAGSFNEVAVNLNAQGKYAEAQPLYEKALAIKRKVLGEVHPDTATGYNNVAANLEDQGKYAEAQPLYEKALAIYRKVLGEEHPLTAQSYNEVAHNLYGQGKYAAAQPLYEKALAINRKVLGEEHPDTATGYNNLAANLNAQGKYAAAQPLYEKALAISRKVLGEVHPDTAQSYHNLAHNLWKQDRIGAAVRLLQDLLPGQEVARFHTAPSGFDRAVAAGAKVPPQVLLALGLARLHQPADAFRHAEASLARGLLDDLAAPTPDARKLTALRDHLAALDRQWIALFGRQTLSPDQKALRERLAIERRQTLARLARLAAEVSAGQLLPLADVQKQLPADAALVLWLDIDSLGEHHACLVHSKGDPAWVRLDGSGDRGDWTAEDLDLPSRLYRLLNQPVPKQALRQRLSQALLDQRLKPLKPHLQACDGMPAVRHLLVVPTGWAGLVPLEVLGTPYRISYVPSGSVYARLRQQHRALQGSSLLALGDPVFTTPVVHRPEPPAQGVLVRSVQPGGSASRAGLRGGDVLLDSVDDLKKVMAAGGTVRYWHEGQEHSVQLPPGPLGVQIDERPAPEAVVAWRQAEASPVTRGPDPVPLPGTRWEVQALGRLVPRSTPLLGSEASEQRLQELAQSGKLKDFRLIHLATHGVVDWQTPQRSRLLLARDRLPDPRDTPPGRRPVTGELTVSAIRHSWDLDADLVTLSACQTALGREGLGEGLLGFAQAFLQCKARAVVLSRWEADDTATALFMLRFYENLLGARKDLKAPLPRAEALEEARKWLRELPRRDAEVLASALVSDKLAGTTRGSVVDLEVKERPVKLPEGEQPYAHPYYWATFVLVGDPD